MGISHPAHCNMCVGIEFNAEEVQHGDLASCTLQLGVWGFGVEFHCKKQWDKSKTDSACVHSCFVRGLLSWRAEPWCLLMEVWSVLMSLTR